MIMKETNQYYSFSIIIAVLTHIKNKTTKTKQPPNIQHSFSASSPQQVSRKGMTAWQAHADMLQGSLTRFAPSLGQRMTLYGLSWTLLETAAVISICYWQTFHLWTHVTTFQACLNFDNHNMLQQSVLSLMTSHVPKLAIVLLLSTSVICHLLGFKMLFLHNSENSVSD